MTHCPSNPDLRRFPVSIFLRIDTQDLGNIGRHTWLLSNDNHWHDLAGENRRYLKARFCRFSNRYYSTCKKIGKYFMPKIGFAETLHSTLLRLRDRHNQYNLDIQPQANQESVQKTPPTHNREPSKPLLVVQARQFEQSR